MTNVRHAREFADGPGGRRASRRAVTGPLLLKQLAGADPAQSDNIAKSFWQALRGPGTIRAKLARLLAAFLVTVVILLGVIVAGEVSEYRSANATVEAVHLTLAVQDLVHELQRERGLTNGVLGGDDRFRGDVVQERSRVDAARATLQRLANGSDTPATAGVAENLQRLSGLTEIRGSVDAGRAVKPATFAYYTDAIDSLMRLDLGLDQSRDQIMRQHITALRALGDAKEAAAQERGFLNGIFVINKFSREDYAQFVDIRAVKRAALEQFERYASVQRRAESDEVQRSVTATRAATFESTALGGADGRPLNVDAHAWWQTMSTLIDDFRTIQAHVGDDVRARADALKSAATQRLLGMAIVVVLAIAAQIALAAAGARAIIRPLAQLVNEANDVAERRLPEAVSHLLAADTHPHAPPPVRLGSRAATEIRYVADALDKVQQAAYGLAVEQVVMRRNTTESLSNLGRRNQNLLRRQLGFISRLERDESDSGALSNLFELDHLATRMRRNAESLLVLVGEESPRVWSSPLPVTDVIRAAISEVEEYRRVVLRRIDEAFVAGGVVADVAHMIAELVENGLAFSPPDVDVEIFGRWAGSHYLIAVVDQGLGMTKEELARANSRLSGRESFLVAPTRFLGHYVVGRLAQRYGVDVQLTESPVTGITARLVLPPSILPDSPEAAAMTNTGEQPRSAIAEISPPSPAAVDNRQPANPSDSDLAQRAVELAVASVTVTGSASAPALSRPPANAGRSTVAADESRNIAELRVSTVYGNGAVVPEGEGRHPTAILGAPSGDWPSRITPQYTAAPTAPSTADLAWTPASMPMTGAPTGGPEPSLSPEFTRNGLVKRVPRKRVPSAPPEPRPVTRSTPVADRPPEEVGSMLSSLRAGVRRGENAGTDSANFMTTVRTANTLRHELEGESGDR